MAVAPHAGAWIETGVLIPVAAANGRPQSEFRGTTSLVNLTAFRAQAFVDEKDTVTGSVGFAVLSKDGRFVLVKRIRFGAA